MQAELRAAIWASWNSPGRERMAKHEQRFAWGMQIAASSQNLLDNGTDPDDINLKMYMADGLMMQGLYSDALDFATENRAIYINDLMTAEALPDDEWCEDTVAPFQQEMVWSDAYGSWVWNTICPLCGFRNLTPLFLT